MYFCAKQCPCVYVDYFYQREFLTGPSLVYILIFTYVALQLVFYSSKLLLFLVSVLFMSVKGREKLAFIKILQNLTTFLSSITKIHHQPSNATASLRCSTYPSQKHRSSHQRCSVRKSVLRNFTKFAGKHLCQSLFFNNAEGQFQANAPLCVPLPKRIQQPMKHPCSSFLRKQLKAFNS